MDTKRVYDILLIMILSLPLLPLGGCFGSDINRGMCEADGEEVQRENHIVGATLKGTQGLIVPAREYFYQFTDAVAGGAYGGYLEGTIDTWATKFFIFNPEQGQLGSPSAGPTRDTCPQHRDILNKTDDPVALTSGKTLRVCIMHHVTGIYDPTPHSKIMDNGNSGEDLAVPHDSQEQVYTRMLKKLEGADKVLEGNKDLLSEAFRKLEDLYYENTSKWCKFVHSTQFRIAMRMSYVNSTEARRIVQEVVEAGVIESGEDNTMFHAAENHSELLLNNWNDYCISADLASIMKGYEDLRLDRMFIKGMQAVDQDGEKVDVYDYYDMRIGIFIQKKDDVINLYSKQVISSTDPYLWMNTAEVTFLRTEDALRGQDMESDARTLYEKAIALSFKERGVTTGTDRYVKDTEEKPINYVSPMDGADTRYSHSAVSTTTIAWGPGAENFERNLECIITQKQTAIFSLGLEAWAEHRHTGYLELLLAVESRDPNNSVNVTIGPRRLSFPTGEYTGNPRYID